MTLAVDAALARAMPAAWIGVYLARPGMGLILSGSGLFWPSGGLIGLMSGTGIGKGMLAAWMITTHWVLAKPSKENCSDSTLLAPSQSMAIGGGVGRNGILVRSIGPQ